MLSRGDWLKPTQSVTPGVPAFLNPLPADAPPTRLGFARWLVDPKAPTTARVFVNRIWQAYFGTGIVATSEDFGVQSDAPSHPELLDWLATEFISRGWSIKEIHRLVMLSNTYRMSDAYDEKNAAIDAENRYLWRMNRARLDGEEVRDATLFVTGKL